MAIFRKDFLALVYFVFLSILRMEKGEDVGDAVNGVEW